MGVPYFVPWTNNVAKDATVTVATGSADPLLLPEYAVNGEPSLGTRIVGTSGRWLFSFASPKSVAVLGLIHHSFKAGLLIRLEGNTTSTFTSPAFSEDITIPARDVDGYGNAWLDVQAANGGTIPSYQFWSLVVDADTNDTNLAFGESVFGSSIDEMPQWLQLRGHLLEDEIETVVHRTYAGVKPRHPKGFRFGRFGGSVLAETPAQYVTMRDWFRQAKGQALPSLIIPDSEESDCHFGIFEMKTQRRSQLVPGNPSSLAVFEFDWQFEELSRGLTWSATP